MRYVRALGQAFFALLGGAIIGSATTVLLAAFLGDRFPARIDLLLVSFGCQVAASIVACYVSIVLSELESDVAAVPRSLGEADREIAQLSIVQPLRPRVFASVAVCATLLAIGIALLPVRIMLLPP